MKGNYHVRKDFPLSLDGENPKEWLDETGKSWSCWPIASEAQMSWEVRCRDCPRWAHWVGIGSPFGDGEQYFLASDSYCYWCFPRSNFSDEELRMVRREDWARKETIDEIIHIILKGYENRSWRNLPMRVAKLVSDIRSATETREDLQAEYARLKRINLGTAQEVTSEMIVPETAKG
jgi:hypothetical protein